MSQSGNGSIRCPIGFFHIHCPVMIFLRTRGDIAEVQTGEGKLCLSVGIGRTSKFAGTRLMEKADRKTAWQFLENLLRAMPYRIKTVLIDNRIQFAERPRIRNTP